MTSLNGTMKIACVSDTHGKWMNLAYPKADVLILAGDILDNYSPDRTSDAQAQLKEIEFLNVKFGMLKKEGTYKEIVLIAGNHDFAYQLLPEAKDIVTNAHYLQDSQVVIDGYKFWGSPWQPWFWDWAFNFPNHNEDMLRARAHAKGCWGMIPDDTDVLVTHGPPLGTLDETYRSMRVGCQYLAERVMDLKLKLHTFGHIHHSYGQKVMGGLNDDKLICLNAAACDEKYEPTNPIQVVEI